MLTRIIAFCALSLASVATASAEDYCHYSPTRLYDGGTATDHLTVVVANVPRPVYPGHGPNRPWCYESWRSLGAAEMPTIIQMPSIGEIRVGRSQVYYKGNKIGHDRFVLEKTWYGPMNDKRKATVVYEVDVVGGPF